VEPLLRPPIGFAHRGARAHAPENSLDAFRLALRLGATGLESDVWLTSDGVPVLDHDGVVKSGLRRRRISELARDALPGHLVALEDLYHPDADLLASWRARSDDVRLVNSTRRRAVKEGMERRAAVLAHARVDALNLHHTDWTGGFTTLLHRFDVLALAWDCQHPRVLAEVLHMGVDGVYSDHVDRMVDALAAAGR